MRQDATSMSPRCPVPLPERPDKPEEACGVFAVMAAGQAVANLTYFGLYALQHRGQESAGIAVFEGTRVRLHKDMGLVSQVFDQEVLERMPGELAIGHNRYSTTGSSKVCNAQPVVLTTRLGPFALAHNGNLVNAAELRASLAHMAGEFTSTTDSELIAFALQEAVDAGHDWNHAIRAAAARCRGAFSLVIGTTEGLFALRDGHGIRPLVFGHIGEEQQAQWVVSSETCGLDIIGAHFDGDVEPGEIIHFRPGDPSPDRQRWCEEPAKLCVFEMIYFARPDSRFTPERELADSERLVLQGGGISHSLRAIHTPGHAANHLCLVLEEDGLLFSGDHVLNGSTTVISPPDGHMGRYLDSLDKLLAACASDHIGLILPAHGYVLGNLPGEPFDASDVIRRLKAHRLQREAKIARAMQAQPDGTLDDWVAVAYDDTPERLWPVAKRSLQAHVDHIRELAA